MRLPLPLLDAQGLPEPADPGQAELGVLRWRERAAELDAGLAAEMTAFADDAKGARLLASLFGNSPFLTLCCVREPDYLLRLARLGPDATFAEVAGGLNRDLPGELDPASLMRRLRIAKRRAALLVALADIAGWWPLERVTGALT
ncbi:MAG: bifunctional [glutamine synthetase] adenylyltransferase/[glutamine synthetase]-adenylyl-L-tyrosine phosphorylase, partial [Stellaceae bacterium]